MNALAVAATNVRHDTVSIQQIAEEELQSYLSSRLDVSEATRFDASAEVIYATENPDSGLWIVGTYFAIQIDGQFDGRFQTNFLVQHDSYENAIHLAVARWITQFVSVFARFQNREPFDFQYRDFGGWAGPPYGHSAFEDAQAAIVEFSGPAVLESIYELVDMSVTLIDSEPAQDPRTSTLFIQVWTLGGGRYSVDGLFNGLEAPHLKRALSSAADWPRPRNFYSKYYIFSPLPGVPSTYEEFLRDRAAR